MRWHLLEHAARRRLALLPGQTATGDRQAETMFPSVARADGMPYAFYNGDGFGRDGIRCAQWMDHER